MTKKVSVITPCYNGGKYLRGFFDSVLAQSYDNIELIFVDDASTDDTAEIAEQYSDLLSARGIDFQYIRLPINMGQAAAINRGLAVYSGDYLMWFDADDIMLPEHIADKVAFLEQNSEYGFVLCRGMLVNEDAPDKEQGIMKREKPEGKDELFSDLLHEKNVVFNPGTIMARRCVMDRVIPSKHIYESRQGQNWQLMLPLAYCSKCGYLEKTLFKCMVHKDSHSRQRRTYDELIARRDDFLTLQRETICAIDQMPENEKSYWNKVIYSVCIQRKAETAIEHRKFFDYFKYKREANLSGLCFQPILFRRVCSFCKHRIKIIAKNAINVVRRPIN